MKVNGAGNRVYQQLKGASLRSFRVTDTLRRINRYSVFADKEISEKGFPKDLNDVRSYLYTFSIINNDLTAFVPSSFLNKLTHSSLVTARSIGDYNAVKNTLLNVAEQGKLAGIGERAVRRVGGRLSGKLLNNVIPQGSGVFSRAAFRGVRSVAGANLTIEMNKLLRSSKGNKDAAILSADFSRLIKRGEVNAEVVAKYIYQMVYKMTPVDSGALIESLYIRKARRKKTSEGEYVSLESGADYHVGIGNVKPMPDPRVPYPWVIEFGINNGFGYHKIADVDLYFPIPKRFKFLERVTGPRPPGDTFYGGFYNNDNRHPYQRSPKNYNKGAMVRTALMEILKQGRKRQTYNTGIPRYKTNPFKELVWDQANKGWDGTNKL